MTLLWPNQSKLLASAPSKQLELLGVLATTLRFPCKQLGHIGSLLQAIQSKLLTRTPAKYPNCLLSEFQTSNVCAQTVKYCMCEFLAIRLDKFHRCRKALTWWPNCTMASFTISSNTSSFLLTQISLLLVGEKISPTNIKYKISNILKKNINYPQTHFLSLTPDQLTACRWDTANIGRLNRKYTFLKSISGAILLNFILVISRSFTFPDETYRFYNNPCSLLIQRHSATLAIFVGVLLNFEFWKFSEF